MNSKLYIKLARTNLWNNRQFYIPYVLASVGSIAMYYIIHSMSKNEGIDKMVGAEAVKVILMLGSYVIAIFSFVFLLYTNGFLMKRRKKELGLLNILGMEKKHIGKMMSLEVVMIGGITLFLGLIFGIVFSKLVYLFLYRLLDFEVPLGFDLSIDSLKRTGILFVLIQTGALIVNWFHLKITKPIDLLKGTASGEREPKIKWFSFMIGTISLAAGYAIAIIIKSPLSAIFMFFIAAILVMTGTYSLFTSGSIFVLKRLKKNKRLYYQPDNFINISSMIYRMRQNAVGLANICILSSAVLVMLSTTVSLYLGMEDVLHSKYPNEITLTATLDQVTDPEVIKAEIRTLLDKHQVRMTNIQEYQSRIILMEYKQEQFVPAKFNGFESERIHTIVLMTVDTYNQIESDRIVLTDSECMFFSKSVLQKEPVIKIMGQPFANSAGEKSFRLLGIEDAFLMETDVMIVSSVDVIKGLVEGTARYNAANEDPDNAEGIDSNIEFEGMNYSYGFDLVGEKEDKGQFLNEALAIMNHQDTMNVSAVSREANRENMLSIIGGFLFIGIFLGILFLMATALIIYYKQVTEGYEDRERYVIMQKVGMSHTEVMKMIKAQIKMVFVLPLLTAFVHFMVAFKMMTRLLLLFSFKNDLLFLGCTMATMIIFSIIYSTVYKHTAKTYYKIVSYFSN